MFCSLRSNRPLECRTKANWPYSSIDPKNLLLWEKDKKRRRSSLCRKNIWYVYQYLWFHFICIEYKKMSINTSSPEGVNKCMFINHVIYLILRYGVESLLFFQEIARVNQVNIPFKKLKWKIFLIFDPFHMNEWIMKT